MVDSTERAPRFSLKTPLRFRMLGERGWRAGETVNVSGSGVLFESESPLPQGMTIEIWFQLPPSHAAGEVTQVFSSGVVVRSHSHASPPHLAARFLQSTLAPAGGEPAA